MFSMRHFRCWRNFGFYNPHTYQNCVTTPPGQQCYLFVLHNSHRLVTSGYCMPLHGCLPRLCLHRAGWIFYCGNQTAAGVTFLKPTQIRKVKTYLSKSFCSDKQVHPHWFLLQCKGRLILLPGNFSFPQLGAQRQVFTSSKLKDFQRLKIDLKVWDLLNDRKSQQITVIPTGHGIWYAGTSNRGPNEE